MWFFSKVFFLYYFVAFITRFFRENRDRVGDNDGEEWCQLTLLDNVSASTLYENNEKSYENITALYTFFVWLYIVVKMQTQVCVQKIVWNL